MLTKSVSGYDFHMAARRGEPMRAAWNDVMMWSVLAGQHQLAQLMAGALLEVAAFTGRENPHRALAL